MKHREAGGPPGSGPPAVFSAQGVAGLLQHLPAGMLGKKGLPSHLVLQAPGSCVAQEMQTYSATPWALE